MGGSVVNKKVLDLIPWSSFPGNFLIVTFDVALEK